MQVLWIEASLRQSEVTLFLDIYGANVDRKRDKRKNVWKWMDGWMDGQKSSCKLELQTMTWIKMMKWAHCNTKNNLYNSSLRCNVLATLSNINEEIGAEDPAIQHTTKTRFKELVKKQTNKQGSVLNLFWSVCRLTERSSRDEFLVLCLTAWGCVSHNTERFNGLKKTLFLLTDLPTEINLILSWCEATLTNQQVYLLTCTIIFKF